MPLLSMTQLSLISIGPGFQPQGLRNSMNFHNIGLSLGPINCGFRVFKHAVRNYSCVYFYVHTQGMCFVTQTFKNKMTLGSFYSFTTLPSTTDKLMGSWAGVRRQMSFGDWRGKGQDICSQQYGKILSAERTGCEHCQCEWGLPVL